jgi:signal transduction histidine kinase
MAVSYVAVTAAAVLLVEAAVLGILLPRLLASSNASSRAATVAERAGSDAKLLSVAAAGIATETHRKATTAQIVQRLAVSPQVAALHLGTSRGTAAGTDRACLSARTGLALISLSGTVVASSDPRACPPGTTLGFAAPPGLSATGQRDTARGAIVWAVSPVISVPLGKLAIHAGQPAASPSASQPAASQPAVSPSSGQSAANPSPSQPLQGPSSPAGKGSPATRQKAPGLVLAGVYAEAPAVTGGIPFGQVRDLLVTGGVVLALVIPVGTVFGLLSTRRVIRRIKRLGDVTAAVAGGDFQPRVPVSGGDEIGRLEHAFNQMTGRLSAAVAAERLRAGSDARQAERARIARELHDSISQDLFSLSLLAAGLRKALRDDPSLRPEVAAMERTAARAMREMQALLLELRPVALEDAGLLPAVSELCQAYQARLAIKVTADLGEVSLGPAAEHAVLRVIQEALGNAARHGEPETITVRLAQHDGAVAVEVRDDGRGFDPGAVAERHGLGLALMRERVTELGGDLLLDAAPGAGTAISVRLPAAQDGAP